MGRRSDHSREEQQSMALAAVRKIIRKKGYEGVSTRASAGEMGYTVGTIYHLFENLDHVIAQVNVDTVREIRGAIERGKNDEQSPDNQLRAMAHAYLNFAIEHPNLWRLSIEHTMGDNDEYRAPVLVETAAILEEVLSALQQIAPSKTEQALSLGAAAFWSGVHGVCHLALTGKLGIAVPDSGLKVLDAQLDAFLSGFVTDG